MQHTNSSKTLLFLLSLLICCPLTCQLLVCHSAAAESEDHCIRDICFPPEATVEDLRLPLRGISEFRYWGFKVYVAALYAPADIADLSEGLGTYPKQLRITYERPFTKQEFITSGSSLLSDNPEISIEQIKSQLDLMNNLYRDVGPNDTYTISFIPQRYLWLDLNGERIGNIAGDEFAGAYYSMWLSRYSIGESFTERLIGKRF